MDLEQLFRTLKTDPETGLTSAQVSRRLEANGKNRFYLPTDTEPKLFEYLRHCFRGFGFLIFLSALASFFLYIMKKRLDTDKELDPEYCIAGFIMLTFFLVSGFFRLVQANDDIEMVLAFRALMPINCTVLRDGRKKIIRAENVVLGDVLDVVSGDRLAADVRFYTSHGLEVNNVALTGKSAPVRIDPEQTHPNRWLAHNLGFACSHVTKGWGLAIVIACLNDSEVGIMARLCMEPCPKSRATKHIKQVTIYTYIVGIVMFFMLLCTISMVNQPIEWAIEFNVGLMISLAPLYLPSLMFFGLFHARQRLLKQQCYVRNMESAYTLGTTTVICSDLVGTMTQRKFHVSEVYVDEELLLSEDIEWQNASEAKMELLHAALLCNEAVVRPGQRGVPVQEKSLYGLDFDCATLEWARGILPHFAQVRRENERLANKPYDTMEKLQMSVHIRERDGVQERVVYVKGPLEIVLKHCRAEDESESDTEMGIDLVALRAAHNNLKQRGRNTCAYASKVVRASGRITIAHEAYDSHRKSFREFLQVDSYSLELLGMVAIHDPPFPNIRRSVERCRRAGIKLVLLTRASVLYARAIARDVGIISTQSETVEFSSSRLNASQSQRRMFSSAAIDMRNWTERESHHQYWELQQLLLCYENLVFARIAVEQRFMVVNVCQDLGAIVTVIGNTVHHTSAVRHGNVGVATYGSAIACQACADIILLDSNFSTLATAIGTSRLMFINMRKALGYALSSCMPMIMAHFAFILLRVPIRLFVVVSFFIDIFVNLLPALTLFYEKAEEDLMLQMPKVYDDYLMNKRTIFVSFILVGMIEAFAVFITYFVYMASKGFYPKTLLGSSLQWFDHSANDISDSYGQEWSYGARQRLEHKASTIFTLTIIVMQCTNLILSKTARASLFKQGFGNIPLNCAVVYLICLGFVVAYLQLPSMKLERIESYTWFFYCIWPMAVFLALVESVRRYVLRRFPGSWLEVETYYG
ncbi:sodium/potassium-transporting ATPase subunit alpha [Drosophila busckii]|nr:sodium/potassium-transporting ATPase subunit alpha [Drosophila busckii]